MIFQGDADLQKLQYLNYMKMAASSSKFICQSFHREGNMVSFIKFIHVFNFNHSLTYFQVWEWQSLEDGLLLELLDWEWKFENGEAATNMKHQVSSFHYSQRRGAILFLLF